MKLEILKSEVFKEVEKRSSLEAASMPDNFEQLWASEYEGKLLDTYWIEGCTSVVQLFKRYLRNETVTHSLISYDSDEKLIISAEMPFRFSDLLEGSITTDVKMMIAANVVYRWMSVKLPDRGVKYNEEATSYANDLRLKLLYRIEPSSVMTAKTDDDLVIDTAEEDERMINKGMDRLMLRQYEKCDHCFEPRRNYGRCDECGPCYRP